VNWLRSRWIGTVQKAYAILSDEELRARYDSGKLQARSAKGM